MLVVMTARAELKVRFEKALPPACPSDVPAPLRLNTTKLMPIIIYKQNARGHYIVDNTNKKFSFFLCCKTFDLDYALACIHCIHSNSKTDVLLLDKTQPSSSVHVRSLNCDSSSFSTPESSVY